MKKQLTKQEKYWVSFLIFVTIVSIAIGVYGVHCVIHGSLFAVVWSVVMFFIACIAGEEIQQTFEIKD